MKYKGQEFKELKFTEAQVFDPPKRLLVWDGESGDGAYATTVYAVIPGREPSFRVITHSGSYGHCAEIPKQKPVTNRELSRWLAEGNGEVMDQDGLLTSWFYWKGKEDSPVKGSLFVRKWKDTEWRKPTREYLGLED